MKKVVLKTEDLCKTYESDGEIFHAIKNLSLEIYEQDFTVIMGSSGSGKSTLLYLLSGLDSITAGKVWLEDFPVNTANERKMAEFRRKSIGFVFQAVNLIPDLSLFENIVLTGYLAERDKKKVDIRAAELLKVMGLEDQTHRLPSQVSGGQAQRGAIARALINSPRVLFADEPTGALNSSQGQNVFDVLTDLNIKGQTIVMVTHDIKAACRADRILFLRDGRIEGDLKLDKYSKEDVPDREKAIFEYLTRKGW